MSGTSFQCFLVAKDNAGNVQSQITLRSTTDLPPGDLLIRVQQSSLNYKDALAASGHSGVAKCLPHVPGIDAIGTVLESDSEDWAKGDEVLVTGYGLGSDCWGGWSELIRVPASWAVRLPDELSPHEAMTLGTAGFTAAQCVSSLQHHGIQPDAGEVLVTGASGGVGCLALSILAQLGYRVVAVSGKPSAHELLRQLGATRILDREEVNDSSSKPLLPSRWSGAVDTIGGNTLNTILRSLQHRGCVAACGLVGGVNFETSVYPFLLRGVTLDGIDSAACPRRERLEIWKRLAGDWKPQHLDLLTNAISLRDIGPRIEAMLKGNLTGRTVVDLPGC